MPPTIPDPNNPNKKSATWYHYNQKTPQPQVMPPREEELPTTTTTTQEQPVQDPSNLLKNDTTE